MTGDHTRRIEAAADAAASAMLGSAAAFAMVSAGAAQPLGFALGALAGVGAWAALRRIAPERAELPLAAFTPVEPALVETEELLLTEAEQVEPPELLLDVSMRHFGAGSRVVRLFDPAAMPTPGELKSRIDRHLKGEARTACDDSQALFDALAELRSSLR